MNTENKTIELIHKLSELGRLVEISLMSYHPSQEDEEQYRFKAEVRKVAGELNKEINYTTEPPEQDEMDNFNFDRLFRILVECLFDPQYWETTSPNDAYFALYSICHKMGVELESEEK